jgi:hypothetical protein
MEQSSRWDILETASLADETAWTEHFTGFVNSFVQKSRRERWLHLLLKRPKQIYSNSHKLHSHLDWSRCSRLENASQLNPKSKGVYYSFMDEPVILTVSDAFVVGPDNDGIFSIVPGKLAIYFFHENENILCKI